MHYLLSAASRTLSVPAVARMTEERARDVFKRLRFLQNGGEPFCPHCGSADYYALEYRKAWRCAGCGKDYSLTSGTIFASAKMPVRDYLLALAIFANAAKGISALQMSRDMGVQYKTAYVLCQKIRSAIEAAQRHIKLSGVVEVDGATFGGHWVVQNHSDNPGVKKRVRYPKKANRRVVTVMRQRGGRTITTVGKSEFDAVPMVRARVEPGSTLHADGSRAWNDLGGAFEMMRVEHADAYSFEGACTNQAESFFSRMRRAHSNHHRISGEYLGMYAAEIAWREDHRRVSNGEQWLMLASLCLHTKTSAFVGYWQRKAIEPRAVKNTEVNALPRPRMVAMESLDAFGDRRGLIDPERSLDLTVPSDAEGVLFQKEVFAYARKLKERNPEMPHDLFVKCVQNFVAQELAA